MKKVTTYLLTLLALGLTVSGQGQTSRKMETAFKGEKLEVYKRIESMVNAFHKQDIEGVMASYTPNAAILFEPQTPVVGDQEIRKEFIAAFSVNPHYEFTSGHEIYVMGETAIHIAPWRMKGTLPDGTPISQTGMSVAILEKQPDGKWLMVYDNPHGQFSWNK